MQTASKLQHSIALTLALGSALLLNTGAAFSQDRLRVAISDDPADIIERRHDDNNPPPPARPNPNQATPTTISRQSLVSVVETLGELEVAVAREGNKAAVAVNNLVGNGPFAQPTVFWLKPDGTFAQSALDGPLQNLRDPTLARGGNDRFYYAALDGSNVNVGVSSDGGQSFTLVGPNANACVNKGVVSTVPPCPPVAQCFPNSGAKSCSSDQPHIAADPRGSGPANEDQIYIVWRETDVRPDNSSVETQMIQCSADGGATWKKPVAVGQEIFARISVDGTDGSVYVVFADTRTGHGTIFLQKFTPCSQGLARTFSDTPGRPVAAFLNLPCPLPGIDRCNNGNILASQTVASDGPNVFVTYADNTGQDTDAIRVAISRDGGATFPAANLQTMSPNFSGRRYMPWSCASGGQLFVGWFDRTMANDVAPDLTTYHLRTVYMPHLVNGTPPPTLSNELDLSGGVEDRQCSVWPRSPRSSADSTSCKPTPPLAGVCTPAGVTGCSRQRQCPAPTVCADGFCVQPGRLDAAGNAPRCNFVNNTCRPGETCSTGSGGPKFGDYNGFACAGNQAFVAWPSSIPPGGAKNPIGSAANPRLAVYFATVEAAPPTSVPVPNIPSPPPPSGSNTGGTCVVDHDCHGVNQHCLNGICKPRGPQCVTQSQCPSGTACVQGACLPI